MNLRIETIKTKDRSLLASVDVIEFQTTDAYSSLDLTDAVYNLNIHSIEEKLKVMLRTRPNSLAQ
jgi:hypothetical protein